jgi:sugar phosphate isomerase/epimerase
MNLAISNIAWEPDENDEILPLLKEYDVTGIEIAPTKRWSEPESASKEEAENYQKYWKNQGLVPIAMQSLLFNRPHLSIFGDRNADTLAYLKIIIRIAGWMSLKALVFGSPKNRLIGNDLREVRYGEAIDFFRALGDEAERYNVKFCIEPNPEAYGCDFICTTMEGLEFIRDIAHPAIRLHLDTGTMLLNGEEPKKILEACLPYAAHFHISEPFLQIPGSQSFDHVPIAEALREVGYSGWVSLEMKSGNRESNKEAIAEALVYIRKVYS